MLMRTADASLFYARTQSITQDSGRRGASTEQSAARLHGPLLLLLDSGQLGQHSTARAQAQAQDRHGTSRQAGANDILAVALQSAD